VTPPEPFSVRVVTAPLAFEFASIVPPAWFTLDYVRVSQGGAVPLDERIATSARRGGERYRASRTLERRVADESQLGIGAASAVNLKVPVVGDRTDNLGIGVKVTRIGAATTKGQYAFRLAIESAGVSVRGYQRPTAESIQGSALNISPYQLHYGIRAIGGDTPPSVVNSIGNLQHPTVGRLEQSRVGDSAGTVQR